MGSRIYIECLHIHKEKGDNSVAKHNHKDVDWMEEMTEEEIPMVINKWNTEECKLNQHWVTISHP